jgi:hypothetical protein
MITIHMARSSSKDIPRDGIILEDQGYYPTVREQIYEALKRKHNLEVFILTRVCDEWFWDLSDYNYDVLLTNDSPTELLKRKLTIASLPLDLATKPDLIIELDLLNLPNPFGGEIDVWKWIIQHKLGEVWTIEIPTQAHFSQLINWYIENRVNPSLQFKIDEMVRMWIQKAPGKLKSVYALFFENPEKNSYIIIAARALMLYDQNLREQWLTSQGWYSPKLENLIGMVELPIKIPITIRQKLNSTLKIHWNTRLKEISND